MTVTVARGGSRGHAAPWPAPGARIARTCAAVGWAACLLALVLARTAPELLDRLAVPVAVAGLVLGVPHGAVDHLVPSWLRGERVTARGLATTVGGYLLVAAVAATALIVVPRVAVVVFLVASALHFGRGEVVAAAERAGRPMPATTQDTVVALAHGAAVVGLPLALWPTVSGAVLDRLAPGVAPTDVLLRVVLAVAVGGLVLVALARLLAAGRRHEAAELLLVTALLATVSPLVAFGVYFGAWHALRHTGRLLALPGPAGPLPVGAALRRFALGAAVPTAAALGSMVVVWRLVDSDSDTGSGVVVVAIGVLLALTFPHLRAVAALDRVQAGRAPARPPAGVGS